MVDTENIHKISQMGNSNTLTVITDGADFPHTGLIKALNQMSSGNIVVKTGADFDINQTGGNIVVDAGKILRNGMYHSVSSKTFADSDLITTHDKGYHLLVVADGREGGETVNNLYLRTPTAPNVVADFKLGDTIVAMIEYASTTSAGSRLIQFFTTSKEENGLSIAYANSNVYTEVGSITGNNNGLFIDGIGTATPATDGSDKVIIQDTSASDVIKSVTVAQINALVGVDDSTIEFNSGSLRVKDGGITVGKMAANSVDSNQYVNGSIDAVHITDSAVTSNKIRDGNVTLVKLDDIADGRVLGNISGSSAAPSELNAANLRTLLTVADGSLSQNNFTDADHSKLNLIADGATRYLNSDAISAVEGEATLALSGSVTVATGQTFVSPRLPVVALTASTTLSEATHAGNYVFVTGSSIVITIPDNQGAGVHFTIINNDGNGFTLRTGTNSSSGDNMNGAQTDIDVAARNGVTCISTGTDYVVLGV